MSGYAACLACPICEHSKAFSSVEALRDRLIQASTNTLTCPVCQEKVTGLDKLTIHLFSHVSIFIRKKDDKVITNALVSQDQKEEKKYSTITKTQEIPMNTSMNYIKIYPKLPIVSNSTISSFGNSNTEQRNLSQSQTLKDVKNNNTICDMCGLQFVDLNILNMHRCLVHNIEETSSISITRHKCHLCPKTFKMLGSLMVHVRVAHFECNKNSFRPKLDSTDCPQNLQEEENFITCEKNDSKQWQCEVCKKCFTTKYFLKKHKRLHTGETPYACSQCNKTFTFQQSYHKHLLYHNDEKPHICSFCGRAFKELSTLNNHQRIHTGEKPFACETCGKCFRQRVSYLVHRRIHTGVLPYKCTACDKSFRYKVSQRTHKCLAQPPGTVIRQPGDLVEKLKKKTLDSQHCDISTNTIYPEISEANAELARASAKLSLEDTETDNFMLINEAFDNIGSSSNHLDLLNICASEHPSKKKNETLDSSNIDALLLSMENLEKSIPSPSEIFNSLSLSRDDQFQ